MKRILTLCTIILLFGALLPASPAQARTLSFENSPINCWRGPWGTEKCYIEGSQRDVPYWTQDGSGNDSYSWDVYYNNNGDMMCVQWKIGTGSWNYTACSYVGNGDHWSCQINTGQNVESQQVTFEFYNSDDNDNETGNACNISIPADEESWSGQRTFNAGPTAVELIDLTARPASVPQAAPWLLGAAALLAAGLLAWRKYR